MYGKEYQYIGLRKLSGTLRIYFSSNCRFLLPANSVLVVISFGLKSFHLLYLDHQVTIDMYTLSTLPIKSETPN